MHFTASLQQFFQNFLNAPAMGVWKYLILGLMVGLEGPIMTLIGAAAAAAGFMHVDLVFISASIGNLSADAIWYLIGYAGKIEWILHLGGRLGIQQQDLQRLKVRIRQHAPKILILAKITNGLIIPSLVAAGLARVPWKRWFPSVALGEMIWTGSLVLIGFYAAHSFVRIQQDVRLFIVVSSVLLLSGLIWLVRKFFLKNGSNVDKFVNDD